MEKTNFKFGKSTINGSFSIANFNDQRLWHHYALAPLVPGQPSPNRGPSYVSYTHVSMALSKPSDITMFKNGKSSSLSSISMGHGFHRLCFLWPETAHPTFFQPWLLRPKQAARCRLRGPLKLGDDFLWGIPRAWSNVTWWGLQGPWYRHWLIEIHRSLRIFHFRKGPPPIQHST